jgi:hypothetical protein
MVKGELNRMNSWRGGIGGRMVKEKVFKSEYKMQMGDLGERMVGNSLRWSQEKRARVSQCVRGFLRSKELPLDIM